MGGDDVGHPGGLLQVARLAVGHVVKGHALKVILALTGPLALRCCHAAQCLLVIAVDVSFHRLQPLTTLGRNWDTAGWGNCQLAHMADVIQTALIIKAMICGGLLANVGYGFRFW